MSTTYLEYDVLSTVTIAFGSILVWCLLLLGIKDRYYRAVVYAGYAIRVACLWWDRYASHIFLFPNVGGDSDMFHREALATLVSMQVGYATDTHVYSEIIGLIYRLAGPQRIIAQYVNVVLGIGAVMFIIQMLKDLDVKEVLTKRVALVVTFFPQGIILSSILLREAFVVFFLTLSLFHYCRWYLGKGTCHVVLSTSSLIVAALFHSGVIVVAMIYALMFALYDHDRKRLRLQWKTVVVAMTITIGAAILARDRDISIRFFGKFMGRNLYGAINYSSGASAYLQGVTIRNIRDLMMYAPLKLSYFLFAPMPWDWRGPIDVTTFFLDSSVYLLACALIIMGIRRVMKDRWLVASLTAIALLLTMTFAFGTNNAGTAARHRNKMMLAYVSLTAIVLDRRSHGIYHQQPASSAVENHLESRF